MCLEGSECRKVFSTFKHKAVGQQFIQKVVDNEFIVCYNTCLLDIVEHTNVVRRTVLDPHVGTQRQTGEARFV